MTDASMAVRDLRLERDGAVLLRGVSFELRRGEFACVLGANGAGKSTLLEVVSGVEPPTSGEVLLFGRPLTDYSRREIAQKVAVVRQEDQAAPGFSIREIVAMGRSPFLDGWMHLGDDDQRIVNDAIEQVGLTSIADRTADALSGGELRLVSCARALAQSPSLLLLDEPTAFLDLARERAMFAMASDVARNGATVLAVVHDLHLDLQSVDRVLCLRKGEVLAFGDPKEVLTSELLSDLYGAKIVKLPPDLGLRFALL